MTTATYGDLVEAYLADPTPRTLDDLREAVRSAPGFDPGLTFDRTVQPLLASGAHDEALAALRGLMPGAIFSPSAHTHLATALRGLGRDREAEREERLALAALRSIVATGDGSARHPWSVLRVSDEYDVLRALRLRPTRQSARSAGGRQLDVLECTDGTELWFDTTALSTADG